LELLANSFFYDGIFRHGYRQKIRLLISQGNFGLKNLCRFHQLSTSFGDSMRIRRADGVTSDARKYRHASLLRRTVTTPEARFSSDGATNDFARTGGCRGPFVGVWKIALFRASA
jgi:hypothetical protein